MALNAFGIDPYKQWKGVWRWYDESMLDCCRSIDEIKQVGITLPEFACLARCNRLASEMIHADMCSFEEFRNRTREVARSVEKIMVVSFNRADLGQTGTGHFSPIGGYCEKEEKVLVLDVARFKYPPYWVSIRQLWYVCCLGF
jgi:hypothetical protein